MNDIFDTPELPKKFHLFFILTRQCNLRCSYCFENNRIGSNMTETTIKEELSRYLNNPLIGDCEVTFFGGEPLICIDVIKNICEWTWGKKWLNNYIFFANTNGTLLKDNDKGWFYENRSRIILGLSLDGAAATHNRNRDNSFESIDLSFFLRCWPSQTVKMTIDSRYPLTFATDIEYIQNQGFLVGGADFAEGHTVDWNNLKVSILKEMDSLLGYYIDNDIAITPLIDMKIETCAATNRDDDKRWCGAGTTMRTIDIDGKSYPCTYFSPLSFPHNRLEDIEKIDFHNICVKEDDECNNCYIRPLCTTCYAANFESRNSPGLRDKSKCLWMKIRALYSAKLLIDRLLKNEAYYIEKHPSKSLMLIEAAMTINNLYKHIIYDTD